MKTALLIPALDTTTGRDFWVWQDKNEQNISKEYDSKIEALQHAPNTNAYVLRDDAYNRI